MIVGIDATTVNSDGGIEHLTQILNEYTEVKGIEKIYIWSQDTNLNKINNNKIIKCRNSFLNKNKYLTLIWKIFFFSSQIKLKKCDIVLYCSGYFVNFNNTKKILIFQNILPFVKRGFKNFILKYLYKCSYLFSDGVIFLSNNSRDIIFDQFKKNKYEVIPHGVDTRYFNKKSKNFDYKKEEVKLIYVSTICDYKNQVNLLKALSINIKKGYELKLTLVGKIDKSYKDFFFKFLRNLKLNKKVELKGHLNKEEIIKLINENHIVVFPSKYETFGLSLLEAMAASKYIICSNQSAMPEIVKENALFFDPEDPVSIATCLEEMLINFDCYKHMSTGSFKEAQGYTWKNSSQKTFEFIKYIYEEKNFNH